MSIDHPSFGKLDDDRIIIFDTGPLPRRAKLLI